MADPGLIETLARIAELLADAGRPWWVIGSAALALHGVSVTVTRDVDVLIDPADMGLLAARTGVQPQPGVPDERFHSAQVLRLTGTPLPVEFFAELHLRQGGRWQRLLPTTREAFPVGRGIVFAPSALELLAILEQFGRDKDGARADLLRATLAQASPRSRGPKASGINSLSR